MNNFYDDNPPPSTDAPPAPDAAPFANSVSETDAETQIVNALSLAPPAQDAYTLSDYASPVVENYSPDNPPWGLLTGFGVWLGSVLALLFVPLAFLLPYVFWRAKSSGISAMRLFAQIDKDPTAIALSVIGTVPAHLLTLLLVWAVATKIGKYPLRKVFGLSWGEGFKRWHAVALAIGLLILGTLAANLLGSKQDTALDLLIKSSPAARYIVAFLAGVTAPIVEEFVYRGILYSAAQRQMGRNFAIALVTLLFASVHVPQYKENYVIIAVVTVLSFVLTYIRARTGRLMPSVMIHYVFNGIQALVLIFAPHLAT